MQTTRQISIWIIFTGLICALTVGCSKPKKTEIKPRASSPETVKHEAHGEPQESGCEDELTDVFFISRATLPHGAIPPSTNTDGRIGFITGKANTLLKTTDGGANWRRVLERKVDGPRFERVLFMSTNEGWAVSQGRLLHTADCGETWTQAPELPEKFYYFGPCAATATAYYQMQPPTCGASVWRTQNSGVIWEALPSHLPRNDYGEIFFFNDKFGWVAGNYGHTARTEDGGQTWQTQILDDGGRLSQIQFVSPQVGWMRADLGHNGNILVTRDGGASWQKQSVNIRSYWNMTDTQFLDGRTGFLLVQVESKKNQVMRTMDGGATWEIIGTHNADITAISFISASEGWAVGSRGEVFYYHQ